MLTTNVKRFVFFYHKIAPLRGTAAVEMENLCRRGDYIFTKETLKEGN
jgi:hypothetical protein